MPFSIDKVDLRAMRRTLAAVSLLALHVVALPGEVLVQLPVGQQLVGKGQIALSTRGPSAFRVRFLLEDSDGNVGGPIDTAMVSPDAADAVFKKVKTAHGVGISASFGTVAVDSTSGVLTLLDAKGTVLTYSAVIEGTKLSLFSKDGKMYGRGGGPLDAKMLAATSTENMAMVDNRMTYVPHYYTTDGYAALGVVNVTTGVGKTNYYPADYSSNGGQIRWEFGSHYEMYFMPAASLDIGTKAYYDLIGAPRVPPRYAFGFIASRWGWQNRSYIESTLQNFRDGNYPIDAFICDFGWFTNVSDYAFESRGETWYEDFGYSNDTFPEPRVQLANYRTDLHIRFGGIRKPRLGNTRLIEIATEKGFILPGFELKAEHNLGVGRSGYALHRNLNYSMPETREWYAQKQMHYYQDGVSFFWNDEGETDYFTHYWWNVAQLESLRMYSKDQRFYSINRAWSPGMARLGATVWTGDINPTWEDLQYTPGLVLNWGLSGAPYVACDIGGFTKQTSGLLLTRWLQLGAIMPTMRVHSTHDVTPHFPWLWGSFAGSMRQALNLRYQLVPYHYSLAHLMFETGRLWMRPLVAEFPEDGIAAPLSSEWLDGELLVAPVLHEDNSKDIYLPNGTWFSFNSSKTIAGPTNIVGNATLDEVPIFVRPGTVVPLAPVVQHTDALPGGPLEVQVYAGADGSFTLVEDDGETMAYESGTATRRTRFVWNDASKTLSWTTQGSRTSLAKAFTMVSPVLFSPGSESRIHAPRPLGESGSISFATTIVV